MRAQAIATTCQGRSAKASMCGGRRSGGAGAVLVRRLGGSGGRTGYGCGLARGAGCRDLVNGSITSTVPLAQLDPDPRSIQHRSFTTLPRYLRFEVKRPRSDGW